MTADNQSRFIAFCFWLPDAGVAVVSLITALSRHLKGAAKL